MPNWCYNHLEVTGDEKQLQKFVEKSTTNIERDDEFSFNGTYSMPKTLRITAGTHLSFIENNIIPGYKINAGEILGRSGNTGTRPSTLGTKAESHLHWELILQDSQGEYYFGQDLDYELLVSALNQIFYN